MIDLKEKIGNSSFSWGLALWCHDWVIHAIPSPEQAQNIIKTSEKLQLVKDYFKKDITITSFLRPELYNKQIGGSVNSRHCLGEAVDFVIDGLDCDYVRERLEPKLEEWQIRMEKGVGRNWVHIDISPVVFSRYFDP